ncbi:hypothetical protein MNBD_ALPHA11-1293 [hydrothermal vent metagenome]|uniref:Uncharacterized protein n=1 Tax=hydrothermal vent metagenome TaxID=652676 RepID=A0A3B0TCX9_9ZZZZ
MTSEERDTQRKLSVPQHAKKLAMCIKPVSILGSAGRAFINGETPIMKPGN